MPAVQKDELFAESVAKINNGVFDSEFDTKEPLGSYAYTICMQKITTGKSSVELQRAKQAKKNAKHAVKVAEAQQALALKNAAEAELSIEDRQNAKEVENANLAVMLARSSHTCTFAFVDYKQMIKQWHSYNIMWVRDSAKLFKLLPGAAADLTRNGIFECNLCEFFALFCFVYDVGCIVIIFC